MDKQLPSQAVRQEVNYQRLLFLRAFSVVPGMEYNQASYDLRGRDEGTLPIFYEVILQEGQSWQSLKERVYPALITYLKYKSMDPESGKGLIVSLFFEDRFHLIECPEFISAFCEIERIDRITFRGFVKQWLSEADLQKFAR